MDVPLLLLRLVHVIAGVVWVGAVLVTVLFIFKVVADMGPAGAQVMGGLVKHRYLDVIPAAALLTVLSGIDLFRRASGNFDPAWMGSSKGIAFSVGGAAALVGLVIGVGIARPTTLKTLALGREAAAMPDGPAKVARMAEVGALRARGQGALRIAAALLVVSTACMAVARYL
jgi:uncharacterized membrane protein